MAIPDKKDVLTYPQLSAFQYVEVEGKPIDEAAEILGVTGKTINNWQRKPAWHDLAVAALGSRGHTLEQYADKLIQMKDKKKFANENGKMLEVDDNVAQCTYLKEVAQVYGLYAPKEIDLRHSVENADDDELRKQIEASVKQYDKPVSPALPQNQGAVKTDSNAIAESGLVAGQQEISSDGIREV